MESVLCHAELKVEGCTQVLTGWSCLFTQPVCFLSAKPPTEGEFEAGAPLKGCKSGAAGSVLLVCSDKNGAFVK